MVYIHCFDVATHLADDRSWLSGFSHVQKILLKIFLGNLRQASPQIFVNMLCPAYSLTV